MLYQVLFPAIKKMHENITSIDILHIVNHHCIEKCVHISTIYVINDTFNQYS